MTIAIKNCGLKTKEAIDCAIESGATFLGFVYHEASPRHLSVDDMAAITSDIPPHIKKVLVIVDPTDEILDEHVKKWAPDILQLHGHESVARVQAIASRYGLPIIKAQGIASRADMNEIARFQNIVDYLLLDAKDPKQAGGTGVSFDWSLLAGFQPQTPWFLSGGLRIDNIAEALEQTGAKFIDVSSGIEAERGVKDLEKIKAFNQTVLQHS